MSPPGLWVPSQIYVEEQGSLRGRPSRVPRFKAQTRIWGYAARYLQQTGRAHQILIEPNAEVKDQSRRRTFRRSKASVSGNARRKRTSWRGWKKAVCWLRPGPWTNYSTPSSTT